MNIVRTDRPKLMARVVRIGEDCYSVADLIHSPSRGWEYLLRNHRGLISRVCHAPPHKVRSAYTSGEKLIYTWPDELPDL